MKKPKQGPKPYRAPRYGILNHFGEIWTPETFATEELAGSYLKLCSKTNPSWKLGNHKVVPVTVTVTAVSTA